MTIRTKENLEVIELDHYAALMFEDIFICSCGAEMRANGDSIICRDEYCSTQELDDVDRHP